MANCLVIFGPSAVGKMTVGNEVAKSTGLKLFHNHMTIELFDPLFKQGTLEFRTLVKEFRIRIFEEMAKSDQNGVVFTYVFEMNSENEWKFIQKIINIFEQHGGRVYFVELWSSQETRLERNLTTFRLNEKPSKRDLNFSINELKTSDATAKINSLPEEGEYMRKKLKNFIKIDNDQLEASEVSKMIIKRFNLK